MRNSKFAAGIVAAVLIFLAGCQPQWSSNRNQVEAGGKTITVLDNPEAIAYPKTEVDALVRLDNVRGSDWLSDDELLVARENRDMKPEHVEGADWYPSNVYVHVLSTGQETPIHASEENQGFAVASPDKTKVFYKTFYLQSNTGRGNLLDLSSRSNLAFTKEDAITIDNGSWIDNDSLIYSTIDGTFYEMGTSDETPRRLLDTDEMFPGNLFRIGSLFYYTTLEGKLMSSSSDGSSAIDGVSNVVWMLPSPDEQRLALVRRIKSGNMELLITDLQGNTLHAIAQDSQIYGMAWSPDGTKLAYSGITPNGTVRGIYIADVSAGTSSPLSLDIKFISDPLRWNPSGNRLMVSSTLPDDDRNRNRSVTYLVRVS
ncbi:TolB family protein [Cohnella boryungensis]|uniref:TolB family protein n=1 Tax=Cohnella boryungensis TaxID=768479 RepID=A0ABV8SEN8_9BACL